MVWHIRQKNWPKLRWLDINKSDRKEVFAQVVVQRNVENQDCSARPKKHLKRAIRDESRLCINVVQLLWKKIIYRDNERTMRNSVVKPSLRRTIHFSD